MFLSVVHKIRLMIRFSQAIRQYALMREDSSLSQSSGLPDTVKNKILRKDSKGSDLPYTGSVSKRVFFNPSFFSAERAALMSSKTRAICLKNPLDRTAADITCLRAVLRSLSSFSAFSVELQKALCRVMRYERFEGRRIVIRKGHVGTSMYFLCYGTVGVVHSENADELFCQQEPIILRRGASFGEMALVTKCKRNATVCCMELCEFMAVDKEDFIALGLEKIVDREYRQRFTLFKNHAIWKKYGVNQHALNVLANESKSELVQPDKVLCQDTRKSAYSYFILQGIIDVYRKVKLKSCPSFLPCINEKIPNVRCNLIYPNRNYIICAKVGSLRTGKWITPIEKYERSFTLVSNGATVIRFENDRLKAIKIFDQLVESSDLIPTDDEICKEFLVRNKWKFWKRSTFERAKYLGKSNAQEGKDILETRAKPNWGKRKDFVKKIVAKPAIGKESSTVKFKQRPKNFVPAPEDGARPRLIDSIHLPIYSTTTFKQCI